MNATRILLHVYIDTDPGQTLQPYYAAAAACASANSALSVDSCQLTPIAGSAVLRTYCDGLGAIACPTRVVSRDSTSR